MTSVLKRRHVFSSDVGVLKRAGLRLFERLAASGIGAQSVGELEQVGPTVSRLADSLQQSEKLRIFEEWSPPRNPPEEVISLRGKGVECFCSSQSDDSHSAEAVAQNEAKVHPSSGWQAGGKRGKMKSNWGVDLGRTEMISQVDVVWGQVQVTGASGGNKGDSLPIKVRVEVASPKGEWVKACVMRIHKDDVEEDKKKVEAARQQGVSTGLKRGKRRGRGGPAVPDDDDDDEDEEDEEDEEEDSSDDEDDFFDDDDEGDGPAASGPKPTIEKERLAADGGYGPALPPEMMAALGLAPAPAAAEEDGADGEEEGAAGKGGAASGAGAGGDAGEGKGAGAQASGEGKEKKAKTFYQVVGRPVRRRLRIPEVAGMPVSMRFRKPIPGRRIRLRMDGVLESNDAQAHAIAEVKIVSPMDAEKAPSAARSVAALRDWLADIVAMCADSRGAGARTRAAALRALAALAASSGSMAAILALVEALTAGERGVLQQMQGQPTGGADGSGLAGDKDLAKVLDQLAVDLRKQERRVNAEVTKAELKPPVLQGGGGGAAVVYFQPKFDGSFTGVPNRYMQLQNGDQDAYSQSSNATAFTLAGGFTHGKASWEFLLVNDTTSQCSCFGMGLKPIVDTNYSSSPQLLLYRSFNGQRYDRGRPLSTPAMPKVNKGDRIRFDLDMDQGTCSVAINSRPAGVAFTNLKGLAIWPCAHAYSSSRTMRILSIQGPPEFANGCGIIGVASGEVSETGKSQGSGGSMGVRVGPLGEYHRVAQALQLDAVPESALYVPAGVLGRRGAEGAHPDDDAAEGVVAQVQVRAPKDGIDGDLPRPRPGYVGNAGAGMDADRLRALRKKNLSAPDHSLSMRCPEEKECLRQVGALTLASYKPGDDSPEPESKAAEKGDDPDADSDEDEAKKSGKSEDSGAPTGAALRAIRASCASLAQALASSSEGDGKTEEGEEPASGAAGGADKPSKSRVQAPSSCDPASVLPLAWDAAERPYCFTAFHLGRRFKRFSTQAGFSASLGVLVDDDGEDDEITNAAPPRIAGVIEVIGDGKVLWRMDRPVAPGDTFEVDVSVLDIDVLVLRAGSAHADLGVNAVFVKPAVEVCDDWTCAGWRNDRFQLNCEMWGNFRGRMPVLNAAATTGDGGSGGAAGGPSSGAGGDSAKAQAAPAGTPHAIAAYLLSTASSVALQHAREMQVEAAKRGPSDEGESPWDLESPYAIELSGDGLAGLANAMVRLRAAVRNPSTPADLKDWAAGALTDLLLVTFANLRRLVVSRVDAAEAEGLHGLSTQEKAARAARAALLTGGAADSAAADTPAGAASMSTDRLEAAAATGTLQGLASVLHALVGDAMLPGQVRERASKALQAGQSLLFKSERDAREFVREQLGLGEEAEEVGGGISAAAGEAVGGGSGAVVELEFSWPSSLLTPATDPASKSKGGKGKGDDASAGELPHEAVLDTALLRLRLECQRRGLQHRVIGHWPARAYLVVCLPTREEMQTFVGTLGTEGMDDGQDAGEAAGANPWEAVGVQLGGKGAAVAAQAGSGKDGGGGGGSNAASATAAVGKGSPAPASAAAGAPAGAVPPPAKGAVAAASAVAGPSKGGDGSGPAGSGGKHGTVSTDLHSMRARRGGRGRKARLPVEGALGRALVGAGLWDWQDHAGSKLADVPLSVEPSPEWSRKYFLPAQPLACVRVYAAANDGADSTMKRVVESIQDFLPAAGQAQDAAVAVA